MVATAAALILTAGLGFATGAQAKCSVTCLNRKVKQLSSALIRAEKAIVSLSKTVTQQGQVINGLAAQNAQTKTIFECLFEAPVTQYGDSGGAFGYLFDTGTETVDTTALDITEKGDPIDAWFIFNACETQTTLALSGGAGPFPGAKGSLLSAVARGR